MQKSTYYKKTPIFVGVFVLIIFVKTIEHFCYFIFLNKKRFF